jgi:hypothetical protein
MGELMTGEHASSLGVPLRKRPVSNEVDEPIELRAKRVSAGPEEVDAVFVAIVAADHDRTDLRCGHPAGNE